MSRYQSQNERNVFWSKIFFLKYFYFFKKTKIELLSSEQNERLCNFLNTRFESHLRLVSAIWGDPPHDIVWHPTFFEKMRKSRKICF